MYTVRVILESEDEKNKIEIEAKKLATSQSGLFRLLFKNWIGEIKLERKVDGDKPKNKKAD